MCHICGQPDNIRCNCQVTQPFCDQCGPDSCDEKIDAKCVFFHLFCTDPAGLPNLGIDCNTDLETILEALDDLVGNHFNIPFQGQDTSTIHWVANGPAGHKPYAHVKVSADADNEIEIHPDGIYAPAPTPFPGFETPITNDCITLAITLGEGGYIITPTLDIVCLINKIRDEGQTEFCDLVAECGDVPPQVLFTCGAVSVQGTFVLGTPSLGSVTIPVAVTGEGDITIFVTSESGDFTGTLTQHVTPLTTTIIVPITYTGGGTNGTIPLTVSMFGTSNTIDDCEVDVIVEAGETCTDVTINDAPLPDASQDTAYNFSLSLNGTAPFVLANVIKPSWMTISIIGGNVVFGGTPTSGDLGEGITVSFDVTNCTTGTDSFSDTIDVIECFGCGDSISVNTADLAYHNLGEFPLCVDGAESVSIAYDAFDRPNRFTVIDNGSPILDSGWAGTATYPGPWGATLSTPASGNLVFSPVAGHTYTLKIEVGNGDPGAPLSDSFLVTINCTFFDELMRFGNDSLTICGEAEITVYFSGTFGTGTIIYSDAGLTTPKTGFDFVGRSSSGLIYNINSGTGEVGAPTGDSC